MYVADIIKDICIYMTYALCTYICTWKPRIYWQIHVRIQLPDLTRSLEMSKYIDASTKLPLPVFILSIKSSLKDFVPDK
jgi:hypothetical protein